MAYEPIAGKLKVKINSKGGSYNADKFREKYEDQGKAYYDNTEFGMGNFSLSGDYKEKESPLSFDLLKEISKSVAPIAAIVNTRIDQVALFTKPSRYSLDNKGYRVRLKEVDRTPTNDEIEEIKLLEDFIYNCGATTDRKRDNFETFIRKSLRDSLVLDQWNFEITYKDNGQPYEFFAVDASTIRSASETFEPDDIVDEDGEVIDHPTDEDEEDVAFVQIIDGQVRAWFTADEMAHAIRNPRTDVNVQPYGLSEIELIIKQLASYNEAEDYNMRFFRQGGMTKGILNIKEDPSGIAGRDSLESFKRQWRTQVTGMTGAWKIPVTQLPGALEFINLQQGNGDIVFEKWINYLINISCAVYKIDPAEINFPNNGGIGGKGNSLFSGEEGKYNQSREKGLVPLLGFVENTINHYIVSTFNNKYTFEFVGINEKSEEQQLANDRDKVGNYMTVNELRQEKGLDELETGDIILNPYFMQAYQQGGAGGGGGFDFDIEDDGDYQDEDVDQEEDIEEEGQEDNQDVQEEQQEESQEDDDLDKAIMTIEVLEKDYP